MERKTDKTLRKDLKMTFRMTPNEALELEVISKELNVKKSKLVRTAIDYLINAYYDKELR